MDTVKTVKDGSRFKVQRSRLNAVQGFERRTLNIEHRTDTRLVSCSPFPFSAPRIVPVPEGLSLRQIVNTVQRSTFKVQGSRSKEQGLNLSPFTFNLSPSFLVEVDGIPVPPDAWDIIPSPGQHVLISTPIHGGDGKDVARGILMIAVIVASIAAPYLAPASWGLIGTGGALTLTGSLVSTATMTAGMFLVNAIAPVRSPQTSIPTSYASPKEGARAYSITGSQNSLNKFGPVPVVLGTHRMYPLYGALPYTEIVGNDEYLRCLFIWGEGPLKIEDIRIGDTAIASFTDYEIETVEGRSTDADLTLIPASVNQQSISIQLKSGEDPVVRQVPAGSDEISIDILFPTGCVYYNTETGAKGRHNVIVEAQYREVGTSDWTNVTGDYPDQEHHAFYIYEKTPNPLRFGRRWTVDRTKTYEVRLWKSWPEPKWETKSWVIGHVWWASLRGIVNEQPVSYPRNLAMSALRIKATGQLNGVISTLSGTVSSYAEVWDDGTSTWGNESVTANPAALFRLVLTHPANARARTAAQISDSTLGAWYEFCADNGYSFNQVRDFVSSVWECLADIAAAGRGSPSLNDGVWAAAYDDPDASVVQHITPRNSWGFSAEKSLYIHPHGFRVAFKNEDNDYADDERIVLDDGYQLDGLDAFGSPAPSLTPATLFESIEFPGITDPDLIWKFARYQIAQARLRPETYSLFMDFEHLGCRRGSRVRVAHDVPMWGTKWGRIKSRTLDGGGTNVTAVTLDEVFAADGASEYVIRVRRTDNTSQLITLSAMTVGEYDTATFAAPVAIASAPEVGDLAIIGVTTKETTECLVKSVLWTGDFSARLELVDVSEAIYDADTGTIPAFNTNITRVSDITDIPPGIPAISAQSGTTTLEVTPWGSIRARIFVACSMPATDIRIDRYRVRYRLQGSAQWLYAEARADSPTAYCTDVDEAETYEIQAQAISVYSAPGDWCAAITHVVVGVSEPPSDVEYFTCNIVGSEAHLSWLPVTDVDLSHYRIRWSPLTTGAAWGDSIDVVERVGKPATHINAPAMIGTYLIKAVDYAGNESSTAATALANVSHIPGYTNAELLELPDGSWSGTGDGAEYNAEYGGICLDISGGAGGADLTFSDQADTSFSDTADTLFADQSTAPITVGEGTYTFTDDVDLGAVFTSRVYAAMTASAVNLLDDLYDHTDLYDVNNLFGVDEGQCGIDLEMRFTSDDPSGTPTWSDWQRVLVGDYTARAFQFRAVLWTYAGEISPCLEAIDIYIDMADRVYPFDKAVEIGGSAISYSPAFYAVPSVGIAVANGQAGDSYAITSHTRSGFTIAFSNGGSGVARTISGVARGYGEEEV